MKGVILGIAPTAHLVDLTHEVPPQDVAAGAWVLHTAWRYFPARTIFLGVVDPGVGSARRAIALEAGDRLFVGPDNGLFSYILRDAETQGAVALANPRYRLPQPSATFHGRDIFAPAAAHLAAGVALHDLGAPLDPATLVRLTLIAPEWRGELLLAHVQHIDHFGNLITDLDPTLTNTILADSAIAVEVAGVLITARARTFAEAPPNAPALLRDSSGHLAIVVRNGSAAALLGVRRGADATIRGLLAR